MSGGRPAEGPVVILRRAPALAALIGALAIPPGAASPEGPGAADALSEARLVEAAINSVVGLQAAFTQTLESAALPAPQVERGTVYLLRPGRMRWEYAEPRGKLALADGRRSYLYLPEDRQVIVAPLGAAGGMSLLLDPRLDLVASFAIAWGPAPRGGGRRPLLLTPRSPGQEYQYLLLEPDEEHLPRSLVVVDPLGGRVTYRFSRARRLAGLDEALFRFVPPEGVEVQDLGP